METTAILGQKSIVSTRRMAPAKAKVTCALTHDGECRGECVNLKHESLQNMACNISNKRESIN